jgi:hypothetical protein
MYQAAAQYSVIIGNTLLKLELELEAALGYGRNKPINAMSIDLTDSVDNEINKIEMVMKLYFPSHVIALDEFRLNALPITKFVSKRSISKTSKAIRQNKEDVYKICQELVNKI